MMVELSFMFIIILGRWILPKGDISHSALSQLLLVYLSLASDILDLLTLFNEYEIQRSSPMVRIVLLVFSLCMLQFALNLTATRGRSFHAEFDQTQIEIHQSAPSQLPTPLIKKAQLRYRQFLSKVLPRSDSSSTTQSFTPKVNKGSLRIKSQRSLRTPDTIFENTNTIRRDELQLNAKTLRDSPIVTNQRTMHSRPSITSLNSLQPSYLYSSPAKQASPRKKSISGSVKFFLRARSSKFIRSEIWSILVTLVLQDGPFFAVRLTAISIYNVRSFLTYFFTFKNFLILLFQSYRIAAILLEKDEQEQNFQEKVNKMRRMSVSARQLGIPLHRKI